jgi:hypothetical protein
MDIPKPSREVLERTAMVVDGELPGTRRRENAEGTLLILLQQVEKTALLEMAYKDANATLRRAAAIALVWDAEKQRPVDAEGVRAKAERLLELAEDEKLHRDARALARQYLLGERPAPAKKRPAVRGRRRTITLTGMPSCNGNYQEFMQRLRREEMCLTPQMVARANRLREREAAGKGSSTK